MNVTGTWRRRQVGLMVVVGTAVTAGAAAWVVTHLHPGASTPVPVTAGAPAPSPPLLLTRRELQAAASEWGRPVYWAGARSGSAYEVTRGAGRSYVRYLPQGVSAGTSAGYLTVATYALDDAFARVTAASRRAGSVSVPLAGGGLVVYASTRPTNVYLAYPGGHEQVEIYDPSPREALQLARSGNVRPIVPSETPVAAGPHAVSRAGLVAHAAAARRPIYWAGPRLRAVYELTETADGRTYLRYLRARRQVGSPEPSFLTVATYPDADAFRHVQAGSRRQGAVSVRLGDGGLAVYDAAHPTSIYLAHAGVPVQVEIFDPSAALVRQLVKTGRVRPIG